MISGRFISYLRVSTDRQGRSGLGLEAQRSAVTDFLNGGAWTLIAEVVEIESGANSERPELARALALCRAHRATLVVAKLDRLARDAHFLLGLSKAGVDFVACDMPSANRMTVGIMAVVAEEERRMISARTKAALAAAKARGQKLGGFRGRAGTAADTAKARAVRGRNANAQAEALAPILIRLDPTGAASLRAVAVLLECEGVPTPSGSGKWTPTAVRRLRSRLELNRGLGASASQVV
ncbi:MULTISPECIES: recombinase family protein [unclassified Methylobacterium]|uniref:recombinase family protein n=1 Tax=unclassified Methylobacterium TaxID=2615210 RepID=UPI0011C20112|nr:MULTISPECIES: recombinase family protein [unclassified Methylobacterium]MCJ2144411.1 recombinase family protein [Methylobacterium sp. E-066]QEE38770.1 recombinase family protein [Methylobacterium sp. WL1]TXN57394.1 recombinase family protein [Methylobacterium sp. WL2]